MMSKVFVIKVLLIGDEGIGKTSLARTITEGAFPSVCTLPESDGGNGSVSCDNNFCPEYRCNKENTIRAGDSSYIIHIFDPGSESTVKQYLSQADICYLCFDISRPETFKSVREKWLISLKCKSKCILVGLRSDLAFEKATRQLLASEAPQPITPEAGHSLANEVKASQYVEVSSLKYLGIEQLKDKTLFDFVQHVDTHQTKEKTRCNIM